MIYHKKYRNDVALPILLGLLLACLSLPGCKDTNASDAVTKKKLPKLYLHCPKNYEPSVKRMREIHDAITSSDPLPDPIVCKVREVVHGEGAGAHSHYHLADQELDAAHDHEVPSDELTHEVFIDAFNEFRDVAKRLPRAAAAGDMEEAGWTTVKEVSKEIVELFDGSILDQSSLDEQRAVFVENKKKLVELLIQLEDIVPADDDSTSNTNEK